MLSEETVLLVLSIMHIQKQSSLLFEMYHLLGVRYCFILFYLEPTNYAFCLQSRVNQQLYHLKFVSKLHC